MADKHLDPSFGRDGISGMVTPDRLVRAREVSTPDAAGPAPSVATDLDDSLALRSLIARAAGRRLRPFGAG